MAEKFYVTTPIYYVNARPHIGHAYTTIVADVLARRHRLLGEDVWFLTGTDEHGQKIERSAAAAGIPPQQFADEVSASFESLWKRMGVTNDQYIRTTDPDHKRGAQKLFSDLYSRGQIYLSSYTGQYSIGEEMFIEGPPGTIGPDGKPTETVTEENFFFRLGDYQLRLLDLIESNELQITPETRRNEVLSFLRGNVSGGEAVAKSAAGTDYLPGALKDLSVSRSSFTWGIAVPEPAASEAREKHVIYVWLDALANYLTAVGYGDESEEGKTKFAKWWPADLHLVGKEITRFHCVYWPAFLMAANLPLPKAITAHGWLLFDDSKMSKSRGNVVRTETILKAFGSLCPPAPSHSSAGGDGQITTLGQAANADLFASDVLRYFLLREIPFGQDGSFTFDAMVTRYNADLANGYGNLVSRTLSLVSKGLDGTLPSSHNGGFGVANVAGQEKSIDEWYLGVRYDELEGSWLAPTPSLESLVNDATASFQFSLALQSIWEAIRQTDQYLSGLTPWKLIDRADAESRFLLERTLYTASEAIRIITALLHPVLPVATANVWRQLGLGDIEEAAARGDLRNLQWGGLQAGTRLGDLGPIFPRADKGLAKIMSDMEAAQTKPNAPEGANAAGDAATSSSTEFKVTSLASEVVSTPVENHAPTDPAAGPRTASIPEKNPGALVGGSAAITTERDGTPPPAEGQAPGVPGTAAPQSTQPADSSPQITIDDFAKVELRVARVLVCERIPKADKLLRLEVDLGYEKRQILSGIAEWYTPEELIGRRIVVITNLAPRKMRGLESHGMLLAGSSEGGKPALATFSDSDDLPLGARLK